jgi:nitroimidazol reductase NimA-like FMN-containing flavoprotein (pyridoxamine 5'-phosphate oxidase superfamily)
MASAGERELVETILRRNRYLVLSTTNGTAPWIAPLEYMIDGDSWRLSLGGFHRQSTRQIS